MEPLLEAGILYTVCSDAFHRCIKSSLKSTTFFQNSYKMWIVAVQSNGKVSAEVEADVPT